jgi:hypothetical protein
MFEFMILIHKLFISFIIYRKIHFFFRKTKKTPKL